MNYFRSLLSIHLPLLFAFAPVVCLAETEILLRTDPVANQIGPDEDVTTVTLEVLRDGKPVDAILHLTLDSPESKLPLSTDFPIVEGTRLIDSTVTTQDGKLELEYMFPIRGQYTLNVAATNIDGSESKHSQTFQILLNENSNEVVNFGILLTILIAFGLVSGCILAVGAIRKASIERTEA